MSNQHEVVKQGYDAFKAGKLRGQCPYSDDRQRRAWMNGWSRAASGYHEPTKELSE
jgi:ribosome modulation factor